MQSRVKKWTTEERTQVCKKGRCLAGRIRREQNSPASFCSGLMGIGPWPDRTSGGHASLGNSGGGAEECRGAQRQIASAWFHASCYVWVSKNNSLQADPTRTGTPTELLGSGSVKASLAPGPTQSWERPCQVSDHGTWCWDHLSRWPFKAWGHETKLG